MDEQNIIPEAVPESEIPKGGDWLDAGVHNVTIADITYAKDDQGQVKKSKAGNPCLIIKFADGSGKTHEEQFWLKDGKNWVFDRAMKAIGADNTQGPLKKDAALGKRLWISIRNDYKTTQDGTIIVKDSGYFKFYRSIFSYDPFDTNNPTVVPTHEGSSEHDAKSTITTGNFYTAEVDWKLQQDNAQPATPAAQNNAQQEPPAGGTVEGW